ncbi:MAG: hypothetical protein QME50_01505 [Candidatus Bathyarchaeota archaeon]|nr:hypothetical protein [Candidatus Bathyarchaeota archaeon]
MYELNLIIDLAEEQLVKGKFRWIANFKEIRRNFKIGEFTFPIYAIGGLEEKGFFLSKIFSAFVTPKYKIHLLLYTSPEIDLKSLRNLIIQSKNKFSGEDWIFLGLIQTEPIKKDVREAVENIADPRVGVTLQSLASKTVVASKNVLGKALMKQLKLTEAKFEAFDLPNYLKSFTFTFFLGILALITLAFFGRLLQILRLEIILMVAIISLVVGHRLYRTRYHTTLTFDKNGFELQEGKKVTKAAWSKFDDVTIFITPKHEICLRLYSKQETLDLSLSKIGISRKEAYNMIKQLIKWKKATQ